MQTNNSSYFSRNLPLFILFMNKYNSAYFFKQNTTLILFTTNTILLRFHVLYNSPHFSRNTHNFHTFHVKYKSSLVMPSK